MTRYFDQKAAGPTFVATSYVAVLSISLSEIFANIPTDGYNSSGFVDGYAYMNTGDVGSWEKGFSIQVYQTAGPTYHVGTVTNTTINVQGGPGFDGTVDSDISGGNLRILVKNTGGESATFGNCIVHAFIIKGSS